MSDKLKVFRLSLSKWLRGNSKNMDKAEGSALRDADTGTYCCLGMFAAQCGVARRRLTSVLFPAGLVATPYGVRRLPEALQPFVSIDGDTVQSSDLATTATLINDASETTDKEKIKALRPIFRKLGYRIEVVP